MQFTLHSHLLSPPRSTYTHTILTSCPFFFNLIIPQVQSVLSIYPQILNYSLLYPRSHLKSPRLGVGTCEPLPFPCWNIDCSDPVQVLCRQPQLLRGHECSDPVMTWRHFSLTLPVLWFLQSFCPFFCDGFWVLTWAERNCNIVILTYYLLDYQKVLCRMLAGERMLNSDVNSVNYNNDQCGKKSLQLK